MSRFILSLFIIGLMAFTNIASAFQFGIYLTEPTASKKSRLISLIKQAKKVGLNTFVIDYQYNNKRFFKNLSLMKQYKMHYVARVVIFPHGGTYAQVKNPKFWQRPYRYVKKAIAAGADEIQLDYIRYSIKVRRSKKNAQNIDRVIQWYRKQIPKNIKLQIDVFGVSAHKPSQTIGQNLRLFSKSVDVICPMVYPSHYFPYRYHSDRPYQTITKSLALLRLQLPNMDRVKVIPWLEVYNFRYRWSTQKRREYIWNEIRAAKDSKVEGYYFWSAKNRYKNLFSVLRSKGRAW